MAHHARVGIAGCRCRYADRCIWAVFACVVRGLEAWRVPRWVRAAITGRFCAIAGEWMMVVTNRQRCSLYHRESGVIRHTPGNRPDARRVPRYAIRDVRALVGTHLAVPLSAQRDRRGNHHAHIAARVYRRNVGTRASDRRRELRCNFPRRGRPDLSHSRRSADRTPRESSSTLLHQIAALVHDDLHSQRASGTY